MKNALYILVSVLMLSIIIPNQASGQQNALTENQDSKLFIITKQNGTKFIGEIITRDPREILLKTADLGNIYIPMHVIESIREILPDDENPFIEDDIFATRYFITTNGLPIKKGENYILWNLFGPDFQFGVKDNLGVGIMTTWGAVPIIFTGKYSKDLGKNKSIAFGALAGTGSWILPEFGLLLPYTTFTLGDRKNNLSLSLGYGLVFYTMEEYNSVANSFYDVNRSEGRFLISFALNTKLSDKVSLVFDSFIAPPGPYQTTLETDYVYNNTTNNYEYVSTEVKERSPSFALLIPGIRWQLERDKAFQFGFSGVSFDGEFVPVPIPMIQFFRRL